VHLDAVVGARQERDDRVVVQPDGPDDQERGEVGGVLRPLGGELPAQVALGVDRDLHVEDQQGDDDGQDAVAERLEPADAHPEVRRAVPLRHRASRSEGRRPFRATAAVSSPVDSAHDGRVGWAVASAGETLPPRNVRAPQGRVVVNSDPG
jgi:hypothetical protein